MVIEKKDTQCWINESDKILSFHFVPNFLHLEFVDFEDRRFFKRMEINIKRLNNMNRKELILIKKNKLTS